MGASRERGFYLATVVFTAASAVLFRHTVLTPSVLGAVLAGFTGLLLLLLAYISWDIRSMKPADSHNLLTILGMYVLLRPMVRYAKYRYSSIKRTMATSCVELQEETLMSIMRRQADTAYGSDYHFREVTCREDFRRQVPLADYAHFLPYVERVASGESAVLTTQPVIGLSTSSGTTGTSKIIPFIRMDKSAFIYILLLGYVLRERLQRLTGGRVRPWLGKVVTLRYKPKVRYSAGGGLPIAPMSYHLSKLFPRVGDPTPSAVEEVESEAAALYVIAVFSLREPEVSCFSAGFSTLAYSFWRLVESRWPGICDDIAAGTLSPDVELAPDVRARLEAAMSPAPGRAELLRRELGRGMEGLARRVWPDIAYSFMTTTGGFAQHARWLERYAMRDIYPFSMGYAASEANLIGVNFSDDPADSSYVLLIQETFFEFIPEAECDNEEPTCLFIEQLEIGENYELVVTTKAGLYRYRLGDIVKVVSKNGNALMIEFQHRLGQMLNLYWEKTPESVFYASLTKTVADLELTMLDYTACEDIVIQDIISIPGDNKHYVLFVEFSEDLKLSAAQMKQFDDNLRSAFQLYDDLRGKGSIGRMRVLPVRTGTFMELKGLLIRDTQNPQFKLPRVLRKPEALELLLKSTTESVELKLKCSQI